MQNKIEKFAHFFTALVLIISFSWAILPMLILRENYVFTIHDGLDSYAAMVQNIHDNHMYFKLYDNMPFMHGIEGKYTMMAYTLYDFLNCIFGYLPGQILTRIIGVFMGFFSMKYLLGKYSGLTGEFAEDIIALASVAYAITPVAPNRMLGYASLPIVLVVFLKLIKQEIFSTLSYVAMLLPLLSSFQAVYIFVLGLWFLFTIVDWIIYKRKNINLLVSFVGMCVITVVSNYATFWVALTADETNRGLAYGETELAIDWYTFKNYLVYGQYHSTALQDKVILPLLAVGTLAVLWLLKRGDLEFNKKAFFTLVGGWFFWFVTSLVRTLQEGGFRTGILIIDGYQWGESIALMRFVWYLMILCVAVLLFKHKGWKELIYLALCFQLIVIAGARTVYNDTLISVYSEYQQIINGERSGISYKEFFSEDLFDEIKKDIDYQGEGAVAYGYHPAVLMFNDFYTIDGYLSVHSMEWQAQFREIIAPALELDEVKRSYYDTWGGRMYIFGPLDYEPTKDKKVESADIYIASEAYKKYGGKYILSRAEISNAEEQGLEFINDYDSAESMYHIYLYCVK